MGDLIFGKSYTRYPAALRGVASEVRFAFRSLEEIRSGPRLASCVYLDTCIEETLRLSPVVPAQLPKEVMKDGIMIDGHLVPAGSVVGVSAYVIHYDREAFPEPWSFRPERWMEADGVSREDLSRARDAMCPFPIGRRGCVGKKLAYIEMRIAIASLLWCYDLEEAEISGSNRGGEVTSRRDGGDAMNSNFLTVSGVLEKDRCCDFGSGAGGL